MFARSAEKILNSLKKKKVEPEKNIIFAKCNLEDVEKNFKMNTENNDNLICVKGEVEKTLKIIKMKKYQITKVYLLISI